MAGTRITNLQKQQPPMILPHQLTGAAQGSVHLRVKSPQSPGERLSQSKSMVLQDTDLPQKPAIARHRRNQSQHASSVRGAASTLLSVELKGEYLNKAKISEGGKKLRKNWTSTWVVLAADQLLFYKESKQEAALSNLKSGARPDGVDLCGAVVDWTTEKSSRKHVVQITTNTGSEYLLQADRYPTICKWHNAITKTVNSLSKVDGGFALRRSNSTEYVARHGSLPGYGSAAHSSSSSSSSPGTKHKQQQQNPISHRRSIRGLFRNLSTSDVIDGESKLIETADMFSTSSKLKHSVSDGGGADKNAGVKNRLMKFIIRRPSMHTLQEKGIIRDRVFGCHLLTLCEREGTSVPKFVKLCLEAVERRGLEADGIYRVSGNLATIQKLRFIIDEEEELDLDASQWEDIHVVTGALKMFFRELPEPLFPFRFFEPFVEAIKNKDPKQKVQALKKLVAQLPKPNRDTMVVLFSHLQKVLSCSRKNLMSTQGLSIVFGPTLMWPEVADCANMAVNMAFQNQIVELMLINSREVFSLDK